MLAAYHLPPQAQISRERGGGGISPYQTASEPHRALSKLCLSYLGLRVKEPENRTEIIPKNKTSGKLTAGYSFSPALRSRLQCRSSSKRAETSRYSETDKTGVGKQGREEKKKETFIRHSLTSKHPLAENWPSHQTTGIARRLFLGYKASPDTAGQPEGRESKYNTQIVPTRPASPAA